jgi:hypothetical protein
MDIQLLRYLWLPGFFSRGFHICQMSAFAAVSMIPAGKASGFRKASRGGKTREKLPIARWQPLPAGRIQKHDESRGGPKPFLIPVHFSSLGGALLR